ncbi:hypothetical protein [Bradyrhizobium daqingense]|uniref:hypothetical protein n=1 Tax=Bradyrhizobium daqingense TaxID=993502 RepID=UPI003833E5B9
MAPLISHSRVLRAAALTAEIVTLSDELGRFVGCHSGREAEHVRLLHAGEGGGLQEARLDRDDGCDSNNDQAGENDSDLHEPPTRKLLDHIAAGRLPGTEKRKPRLGEAGFSGGVKLGDFMNETRQPENGSKRIHTSCRIVHR